MDYKSDVTLNEKDSLQDMLNLEKNMVKVYSTIMTEGVSKGFRTTVKNHWNETVEDQAEVYFMMTDKGYTEVQSAPETALSKEKNKFMKVKSQLC
ncbi:MAG: spore coat protein [Clostridia bacterium]|nr:spore coat protein [Clostridia bacterium]